MYDLEATRGAFEGSALRGGLRAREDGAVQATAGGQQRGALKGLL